jgi:hypothetical protein
MKAALLFQPTPGIAHQRNPKTIRTLFVATNNLFRASYEQMISNGGFPSRHFAPYGESLSLAPFHRGPTARTERKSGQ